MTKYHPLKKIQLTAQEIYFLFGPLLFWALHKFAWGDFHDQCRDPSSVEPFWVKFRQIGPSESTSVTFNTSACYTQQVEQLAVQHFDSENRVFPFESLIKVEPSMLRGEDRPVYARLPITLSENRSHSIRDAAIRGALTVSHRYIGAPCSAATSNHGDRALMWTEAAVPVHLTPAEDGNQCSLDTPPRLRPPSLALSSFSFVCSRLAMNYESL